ncbi:hypothetical protein K466DRAFT_22669 [Polyporus arcularius HHB13444]|uniref:Uncharacterized protein n=1 Tax=Polyporus arcularius HHB13444 TaxID=1314778 RepID=A0A5C3PX05_9APHY|nr:hypothetical protein K466DRAFT_22669 [Polyporus arcularius HHB13444]
MACSRPLALQPGGPLVSPPSRRPSLSLPAPQLLWQQLPPRRSISVFHPRPGTPLPAVSSVCRLSASFPPNPLRSPYALTESLLSFALIAFTIEPHFHCTRLLRPIR